VTRLFSGNACLVVADSVRSYERGWAPCVILTTRPCKRDRGLGKVMCILLLIHKNCSSSQTRPISPYFISRSEKSSPRGTLESIESPVSGPSPQIKLHDEIVVLIHLPTTREKGIFANARTPFPPSVSRSPWMSKAGRKRAFTKNCTTRYNADTSSPGSSPR
jgi:hypothetical protein